MRDCVIRTTMSMPIRRSSRDPSRFAILASPNHQRNRQRDVAACEKATFAATVRVRIGSLFQLTNTLSSCRIRIIAENRARVDSAASRVRKVVTLQPARSTSDNRAALRSRRRIQLNYGKPIAARAVFCRETSRPCGNQPSLLDQLSLARYQRREESWVFARDRLPAAYRTLFRSAVPFGNSIVDPQSRTPHSGSTSVSLRFTARGMLDARANHARGIAGAPLVGETLTAN